MPRTLIAAAALLVSSAASAVVVDARPDVPYVLQETGWHHVVGDMQAQATTIYTRELPVIGVWTRRPAPTPNGVNPYGRWIHTYWLVDCDRGMVGLLAMITPEAGYIGDDEMGSLGSRYGAPAPGSNGTVLLDKMCRAYGQWR